MLRWIGGVLGFFAGFIGCMLLFAYLATQHNVDVFHTYLVDPIAPAGGYRTPFDVPLATWPSVVAFVGALVLAKLGASLGRKLGSTRIKAPVVSVK